MATMTTAQVAAVIDASLQSGDVVDYIAPLFQTVAGSNAARAAFSFIPAPGFTEQQKAAIVKCASRSSAWLTIGQSASIDANNVGVLQRLIGAIVNSSQAAQTGGILASCNLAAALAAAIS